MRKNYIVHYKRGRVAVTVDTAVIDLRGERYAVAQTCWHKLMGFNALGEEIKGQPLPASRDILMDEIFSRPQYARDDVWWTFHDTINFTWVSNG